MLSYTEDMMTNACQVLTNAPDVCPVLLRGGHHQPAPTIAVVVGVAGMQHG